MVPRLLALALGVCASHAGLAYADVPAPAPAAPGLALQAARATASDALKSVVQKLPAAAREKLPGVYVAFAPDPKAALALAACDDDGDYVVVLSDAMLALVDAVARAKATDDALSTTKLEAYARLLAKAQQPGERLLTPPAGFYDAAQSTPELARAQVKQFRAIVTYLVATEVAHMTAGDLVCGRPTATHERGDDEWTAQEQEAALAVSREVHEVRRVATADARGAAFASDAGESDAGYVALLVPLLAAVEATPNGRASMPYVDMHKNQAVRAQIVQTMTARGRTRNGPAPSGGAGVRPASPAR
jgi:hypothetical protein